MTLVTFARSLALTFSNLSPQERSEKIQAYLLVGIPGRGAVPVTDEAARVLRNYERLSAGAPGALLLARTQERKNDLARCRALLPESDATKAKRRKSALRRWEKQRERASRLIRG